MAVDSALTASHPCTRSYCIDEEKKKSIYIKIRRQFRPPIHFPPACLRLGAAGPFDVNIRCGDSLADAR